MPHPLDTLGEDSMTSRGMLGGQLGAPVL